MFASCSDQTHTTHTHTHTHTAGSKKFGRSYGGPSGHRPPSIDLAGVDGGGVVSLDKRPYSESDGEGPANQCGSPTKSECQ